MFFSSLNLERQQGNPSLALTHLHARLPTDRYPLAVMLGPHKTPHLAKHHRLPDSGLIRSAFINDAFPCLPPPPPGTGLKRNLIGLIQFLPLPAAAITAQTTSSDLLSVLIVLGALTLTTALVWLLRHHVPATPIHHSTE
jgi:hypothetical protein